MNPKLENLRKVIGQLEKKINADGWAEIEIKKVESLNVYNVSKTNILIRMEKQALDKEGNPVSIPDPPSFDLRDICISNDDKSQIVFSASDPRHPSGKLKRASLRHNDFTRVWTLLEDYSYELTTSHPVLTRDTATVNHSKWTLEAPVDCTFDFADVPLLYWLVIYSFDLPIEALLFHDLFKRGLLKNPGKTFEYIDADYIFLNILEMADMPDWKYQLAELILFAPARDPNECR